MKRQKIQNLVLQKGIFIHFLVLKPHTSSMAVGALWVKLRTRIIMGRKSQGKEPTKARGQVSALRGWRAVIDVMMTPKEGQMGEMEVSRKGFYIGGGSATEYTIAKCRPGEGMLCSKYCTEERTLCQLLLLSLWLSCSLENIRE